MRFELLVAIRYLKARRKQAVISLITVISIMGVAAGVAALIIALAINAGFREDLQNKLLGAQPHLNLLKRQVGFTNYNEAVKEAEEVEGVAAAAPVIHQTVLISSSVQSRGVYLKGIVPEMEDRISALSGNIVEGGLSEFGPDSIIIGQEMARSLGTFLGDRLKVLSAETQLTPLGAAPRVRTFVVSGIFSSGLFEYDNAWAYVSLSAAQRLQSIGDVATVIEVKVDDIYQAREIGQEIVRKLGPDVEFTDWISMNQSIFQALRMERLVMFITIGLIVIVAALNIVATLIMMVLEKTRDVAILMSMGATQQNIRRIFMYQGVIIGVIGTVFGVALGHILSYTADTYRLISLAPDVYAIAYVPFKAQVLDTVIVAASAIVISFLATLYPSAAAARLQPVESLRYE